MASNYRSHLEWEYRDNLSKVELLKPLLQQAELNYSRAKQSTLEADEVLACARDYESSTKETFRSIHNKICQLKKHLGEYETELFNSDDEWEDWHQ